MPQYFARRSSPTDADVAMWYTLNHHHVVRSAERPIASVAPIGFRLLPCGFCNGNRAPTCRGRPSTPQIAADKKPRAAQADTV